MTHAAHDCRFADDAKQETATVIENVRVARDTYRLRVATPAIAGRIAPGQFVMLRLAGFDDPLLGRPLALYDTVGPTNAGGATTDASGLDVVYLVQGKLTTRLARFQPGQQVELWGPLGNGFRPATAGHLVMVAGGIGQTPFLALAQESLGLRRYGRAICKNDVDENKGAQSNFPASGVVAAAGQNAHRVTLCYGARSADLLAGVDDFRRANVEVRISTDDGSAGHHGYVTELLARVLDESAQRGESPECQVVACGPESMLAAVAHITAQRATPCAVSLETPMACGIGICFSCVTRVKDDTPTGWDYRRTCVEGPVFDAAKIVW